MNHRLLSHVPERDVDLRSPPVDMMWLRIFERNIDFGRVCGREGGEEIEASFGS
jgi:hypothetical protein